MGRIDPNGISEPQRRALDLLASHLDAGAYLAGGVAIALSLKHRTSNDLDVFIPRDFDPERIIESVSVTQADVRITERSRGTLHLEIERIPVSVLSYRHPSLEEPLHVSNLPLPVASLVDLACMKVAAIVGRGYAKDFWDLEILLSHGVAEGSLADLLQHYATKYPRVDVGHAVKSLVYFADADAAPLPLGLDPTHWTVIKEAMRNRVRDL